MLIQMVLSFLLIFIFLPIIVIKFDDDEKGWLDKLFISLIHSTFFFITTIHLLALVKLYETISLIVVYILSMVIVSRFNSRHLSITSRKSMLTKGYDLFESNDKWKKYLQETPRNFWIYVRRSWDSIIASFRTHWIPFLCIIATLIYAAYTRFKHSFTHLYFGSSDPYVHLINTKYLGDNKIFGDGGLYPYGYVAVISAINKFFNMDPYTIIRFIGPLSGMLMVLSIFYTLRKIIGAQYLIIFISLFVYVVYADLPTYLWRQISALSMEYAVIFLLPGITLLVEYLRKQKTIYLILAGECLAITLFIHLYTAAALGIAYILIGLCYYSVLLVPRIFKRFIAVMFTAGIVGLLPLILGYLFLPPLGEFTYVTESLEPARSIDFSMWIDVFLGASNIVQMLLVATCIMLLYRVFRLLFRRNKFTKPYTDQAETNLLLIFVVFYMMYESRAYGLPVIIPADRFGVFFSLIFVVAFGVVLNKILTSLPYIIRWNLLSSFLILIIAGTVLWSGKVNYAPLGNQYQYDVSVEAYLKIKKEFPALAWTIISPVEEYPLIINYGWHSQIWELVQVISKPEGKTLIYPTDDIFIFVEKVPLGSDKESTEQDALLPFPELVGNDLTEFYYRNIDNRRILEAKAFKWAESRMNDRDMTIYYDSDVLRVYWIHQNGKFPQDLLL